METTSKIITIRNVPVNVYCSIYSYIEQQLASYNDAVVTVRCAKNIVNTSTSANVSANTSANTSANASANVSANVSANASANASANVSEESDIEIEQGNEQGNSTTITVHSIEHVADPVQSVAQAYVDKLIEENHDIFTSRGYNTKLIKEHIPFGCKLHHVNAALRTRCIRKSVLNKDTRKVERNWILV